MQPNIPIYTMIICQICKLKSYSNNRMLSRHLRVVHNIVFELYAKENRIWPKCKNANCDNFTKTLFNKYCSTKCRNNDIVYREKMSKTKIEGWANGDYINWTDKKIRTPEVEEKLLERSVKQSATIQKLVSEGKWGHEATEEERKKQSELKKMFLIDNPNYIADVLQSEESRKKRKKSLIKAYESQELRDKIAEAVHDSMTPEIRKKISNSVCETIINTNWAENVKNGYITGYYDSKKSKNKSGNNSIWHRSSYERKAFMKLDYDSNVKEWLYEWIKIPIDEIHNTVPDFIVEYSDGSKKIIEVKPKNKMNDVDVIKKIKAMKKYCEENNMKFELWIEEDLF